MVEDIESQVIERASEHFQVPENCVERSSSFISDFGADELDIVEFIMKLEDVFGVMISEADSDGLETVGDAISLVERLVQEQR